MFFIVRLIAGILIAFILAASCQPAPKKTASPSRPNILFLISDDHSAHDSYTGSKPHTPALDRLAAAGARFTNAYASSPQCSPSRASMLTGRSPHASGTSRLHSTLTAEHNTIVEALQQAGYYVGAFRKVHLGESFQSRWNFYRGNDVPFEVFFRERPRDRPFFLWVGFDDPHRPYTHGAFSPPSDPVAVNVPGFLPDTDAVRRDLADYYDEIARMDTEVARILELVDAEGLSKNTLVVFSGDNGMPFPGAKGSLYHAGVNVPLIVRWPGHITPGQVRSDVVSLVDLAPTWLEAAGASALPRVEGKSLLPTLRQSEIRDRPAFFERNWHDNLDLIRGMRSGRYLLIQNYRPELQYPPTLDLAGSPSWISILELHQQGTLAPILERRYFSVPRPEVELYDVEADPFQLHDLAPDPAHATTLHSLQGILSDWMISTNDFLPPPIPPKRGAHGESIHR